jgi:hypothetical protein
MEADRAKDLTLAQKARLVLEFSPAEFDRMCMVALKEGLTVNRWAQRCLTELAKQPMPGLAAAEDPPVF